MDDKPPIENDDADDIPADEAPKKRGRPRGLAKTGGRKRIKDMTEAEVRGQLLEHSKAIETLSRIARGDRFYADGDGVVGKTSWRRPSIAQRLRALELVLAKTLPDLTNVHTTSISATAEFTPEDAESLRKAALEDWIARSATEKSMLIPQHDEGATAPVTGGDRWLEAGGGARDLVSYKTLPDTPSESDTPITTTDFDGGIVSSCTPDEISAFDAQRVGTTPTAPRLGDTVQLGEGFTATLTKQEGSGKLLWFCFNAEGDRCAVKATKELAQHWFDNFTAVGQALNKPNLRVVK
jgi:hypothetical protein